MERLVRCLEKAAKSPCIWAAVGTAVSVLVFLCFLLVRRAKRKKTQKRTVEYVLPDRRNAYVRARLHTALQVPEKEEEERERAIRLDYARELLCDLKNASLTLAERLEADELSAVLALYGNKPAWSAFDLRAVNDCLGRLLRLSARYSGG